MEHWLLLTLTLVVVSVALAVQGLAHSAVGRASTVSPDRHARPARFDHAGPILDLDGSRPRSITPPDRTVALTFDDGPDPRWTPRILDVLARNHVPGTFFMVGSHVADHAGTVRQVIASGNEVGNHTFTHTNLTTASSWRDRLELRLTQVALAAATGHHSVLLRPPYSSVVGDASQSSMRRWRELSGQGYLIVLATLDTKDWRRTTNVEDIVRRATPRSRAGGIVLMHDGGGDRHDTVTALDRLIPALKARGYRFVTAGEMAGLSRSRVMPDVGRAEQVESKALPAAITAGEWLSRTFAVAAVVVAALAIARLAFLLAFARRHAGRRRREGPAFTPAVSILVPASNERVGIEAALRSLHAQDYPDVEIVVVDDGSTDGTDAIVARLVEELGPDCCKLLVQENRGKAAALNTGLRQARGEIIVTVDADTVFALGALHSLVQHLARGDVGAVAGNTKVADRSTLLGRWQHLEYVMGFNLDRRMHDVLGCMPTVPGAIGAFRATALRDVGGFSSDTLAEDTDLTMALHRAGWRVAYEPLAVAYTEAPSSLRDLWRQRYRWSYGTLQSAWKHRRAVVEGRPSRRLGLIGLPYLFLFQIVLPLLGPLVDLFALYGLFFADRKLVLAFWLGFTAVQVLTTAYALRLDRESYRDLWAVPLQQVVYRQLMYLVVVQAVFTAVSGVRTGWHKLRRTGAAQLTGPTPPPADLG